jgi:hypothetical protein
MGVWLNFVTSGVEKEKHLSIVDKSNIIEVAR